MPQITFTANGTWTAPANGTAVVEIYSPGGDGADDNEFDPTGEYGGGGGGYAKSASVPFVGGQTFSVNFGSVGLSIPASVTLTGTVVVSAMGGGDGSNSGGGSGGYPVVYIEGNTGENGGAPVLTTGGAGGAGAGPLGGTGGSGGGTDTPGSNGSPYGGGGGGAGAGVTAPVLAGGTGDGGAAVITYTINSDFACALMMLL